MRSRCAFTLIEVLLAMALLALLLGAFYSYLNSASSAQQAARDAAAKQLAARTLCDMLERDLMCSLAGDPSAGAGINGSATELSVLTRSVGPALATAGYDDRSASADLESATYRFDESNTVVTISRAPVVAYVLDVESREDASGDQPAHESIGPLERVRFRYYDGRAWRESFDSNASDRLPAAVEIAVWLHPIEEVEPGSEFLTLIEDTEDQIPVEDEDADLEDEFDREFGSDTQETPRPDVVRVVIIPDANPGEAAALTSQGGEPGP